MNTKIVEYDSDEAAKLVTVTGWVSKDGRFFGSGEGAEHIARWSGCTHIRCECGELEIKGYTKCKKCRDKAQHERYLAYPIIEWDGKSPLYSDAFDVYFFDVIEEIEDFCYENNVKNIDDLELVACYPAFAHEINEDLYEQIIPEDGELPVEIQDAMIVYNEAIRKCKTPVSWFPDKKRVIIKDIKLNEQ